MTAPDGKRTFLLIDLDGFRRGFHVGDRVSVTFNAPHGEKTIRTGVIAEWRWSGQNYRGEDELPPLYLIAQVEFERLKKPGFYYRDFDVESLTKVPS